MRPEEFPVNQTFPSRSKARPCGPVLGVFNGYSRIIPVAGSSRPNRLLNCPVHQSEPSGATAGACGPEFGVGTLHSRIVTSSALALLPAGAAADIAEYRSAAPKNTAALVAQSLFVFMAAPFVHFLGRILTERARCLDNTLRAKFRNPVGIVSENLAVDSLIMLSELRRGLIESGRSLGKTYGQSHGIDPVRHAVLGMDHGNRVVSGYHARIVDRHLGIAHFGGWNSSGVEFDDRVSGRFGNRPLADLRIAIAIKADPHITRAKALVLCQIRAAHNLEEAMRKSV